MLKSRIDLSKEKKDETINFKRLEATIKSIHPTNRKHNFYSCGEVCLFNSGCHKFLNSTRESEFNKFGIGISLYFKFVKYLTFWFLMFSILSLPMVFIYTNVASSQDSYEFKSFDSVLYSTTIGALSEQFCLYATLSEITAAESSNVAFKCANDAILNVKESNIKFGLSKYFLKSSQIYFIKVKTDTSQSCLFVENKQYNTSCLNQDAILSTIQQNCEDKSNCSFLISKYIHFQDDGSS